VSLEVSPVAVTGTWWRHLPAGGDPAQRGARPASGRWQRGDTLAALYLASDADTCWAAWCRGLAEDGVEPLDALTRDLWRFAVALDGVAALDNDERLERGGLSGPTPSRAERPRYVEVGRALRTAAGGSGPRLAHSRIGRPHPDPSTLRKDRNVALH
jgi:hypothetical protein